MTKKRGRALAMALFFLMSSVVPVRQANAYWPIAVGFFLRGLVAGGSPIGADLLTAGVTNLIGGTIAALALTPSSLSDSTPVIPIRIPTTTGDTSSQIPPAVPNGTAPSDSALVGNAPVGGTTDGNFSGWTTDWSTIYPTMAASASNGLYQEFPPLDTVKANAVVGQATAYDCWAESYDPMTAKCNTLVKSAQGEYVNGSRMYPEFNGPARCPAGYVYDPDTSTSGCKLTDPAAATKDALADFRRNGQEYFFADADSMPPYVNNAGGKVGAYGTDSQGRPTYVQVTPTADGGSHIGIYTNLGNGQVQGQSINVGANGVVTGANAVTATGSVTAPTAVHTPAVVTGVSTSAGTAAGTGTGTTTTPLDIVFPTDYARTGEAVASATSINTRIDANAQTIKTAIEAQSDISTATKSDPDVPSDQQLKDALFSGTFTPLLSWSVPGHVSACPTANLSFTMFGHYTPLMLDAHCTIFEMPNVRSVLSVVMQVVWVVVALFVLLGA